MVFGECDRQDYPSTWGLRPNNRSRKDLPGGDINGFRPYGGKGMVPIGAKLWFKAHTCLHFRLGRICVMDCPDQSVLPALVFRSPLGIVTADCGGTVPQDRCNFLEGSAFP